MSPDYSSDNITTFLIALVLCIVFILFNKPIAGVLARRYLIPIRWLFGEKSWLPKVEHVFLLWGRFTFYAGALFALGLMVLTLISIYHLY
jgi:hypothetical protein